MLGYYYFSSIYPFFKIIIGNEKIFDVGIVLTHSKFMTSSESFKVITLESSFLVSLVFITSTNARCLVVTQVLQMGHFFLSQIKEILQSSQNGKCPQFRRYEAVGDLKQLWQIK